MISNYSRDRGAYYGSNSQSDAQESKYLTPTAVRERTDCQRSEVGYDHRIPETAQEPEAYQTPKRWHEKLTAQSYQVDKDAQQCQFPPA
jgi:hypothetical protein